MPLIDRPALDRQRRRAKTFFLRDAVVAEAQERLFEVNRTFTAPAVVTWHPAPWAAVLPGARVVPDAEVLDLEVGAHDLVVHDLSLHWAEDPVGQVAQAARALRPDGFFLGSAFAARTLEPLRAALAEAEAAAVGGLSPRLLPMADLRAWGDLLGRGGLVLPVADASVVEVSYPDALALMRELGTMGEGNALAARRRTLGRRDVLLGAAARHPLEGGRAVARLEVAWLSAWAPGPGQPTPLRPGSATRSLLDALEAARGEGAGEGGGGGTEGG